MTQPEGPRLPAAEAWLPATPWGTRRTACPRLSTWAGRPGSQPPYLPEHEADRVHHGGLDNLPPGEDAPRDSVGLQLRGIGDVFTLGVGAQGRSEQMPQKQLEPSHCPEGPHSTPCMSQPSHALSQNLKAET